MADVITNATLYEFKPTRIAAMINNVMADALANPNGKTALALKHIGVDPHDQEARQKALKGMGFNEGNIGNDSTHRVFLYKDGSQVAILSGEYNLSEHITADGKEANKHEYHIQRSHGAIGATGIDVTDERFLDLLLHPKDKPLGNGIRVPLESKVGAAFNGADSVDMAPHVKAELHGVVSALAKNDSFGRSSLEQVAAAARAAVGDYSGGTVLAKPVPTDTQGRKV